MRLYLLPCLIALSVAAPAHAVNFVGPAPYLSAADNPYLGGSAVSYLETFEDGAMNAPGLRSEYAGSVLGPSALTDSVDGDDGTIDGSGAAGHSWHSGGGGGTGFVFSGAFPTHVGLVITDIGTATTGAPGHGTVTFEAIGRNGSSLGAISFEFGDGTAVSATAEDRFVGAADADGISRVLVRFNSPDWEVDHITYSFATVVAEPAAPALLLAGLALLARRVSAARRHHP